METNEQEQKIELYSRQYKIISPEVLDSCKIICCGCGTGGSFIVWALCKMGVSNIEAYDFDRIEIGNTCSQLFGIHDVNKFKVDALAERIKQDVGIDIIIHNEKIDEDTIFDITGNTIILSQVDSIEARKLIYDKVKGMPVKIIDGRIGGETGYVDYVVDCMNESECKEYEKTFEGTFVTDMPCGEKAIIYSSLNQVTEEINIIKRILTGEKYPKAIHKSIPNFAALVKW